KGIRCALCNDVYSAKKARQHNNANVLVLPGRFIDNKTAEKILD
ncbi:MAG TPA: ribose-5-phosphate isomerase, partial [Prevotella sp.]|nr:ribose-5-phosphate isomerase [Prevotella sp.]